MQQLLKLFLYENAHFRKLGMPIVAYY